MLQQHGEIEESMRQLDHFDRTHGAVKRKVGYPRITLAKDLNEVNVAI